MSFPQDCVVSVAHDDHIDEDCLECGARVRLDNVPMCDCQPAAVRRMLFIGFLEGLVAGDQGMIAVLAAAADELRRRGFQHTDPISPSEDGLPTRSARFSQ
jgi:hypothetical protein